MKSEMRRRFRRQLEQKLPTLSRELVDRRITNFVYELLKDNSGQCAGYRHLPEEPDLWPLFSNQSGRWAFPKIEGEDLRFFKPLGPGGFNTNRLGISEPQPEHAEEWDLKQCEAVLVPGIAFDRRGSRLGRGKGFYDRALRDFNGRKIGVCYSFQISNEDLPTEGWDQSMDVVVTEKFLLWPLNRP